MLQEFFALQTSFLSTYRLQQIVSLTLVQQQQHLTIWLVNVAIAELHMLDGERAGLLYKLSSETYIYICFSSIFTKFFVQLNVLTRTAKFFN